MFQIKIDGQSEVKATVKKAFSKTRDIVSQILSMFGLVRKLRKTDRLPAAYIASSDWLIGKPNSSKLIGIINSTRRDRAEKREGAR